MKAPNPGPVLRLANLPILAFCPALLLAAALLGLGVSPGPWGWGLLGVVQLIWLRTMVQAAMSPSSQLFGPVVAERPNPDKLVALTFDDGPSETTTGELLDLLAEHGARATFFVVGSEVEKRPEVLRRTVVEGHAIGNHTWSHPRLVFCGVDRIAREIDRTQNLVERLCGQRPQLFRPPFGLRDPRVLRLARSRGLRVIHWGAVSLDWELDDADEIAAYVAGGIPHRSVMLLHDGVLDSEQKSREPTVRALRSLLPELLEQGYRFVTVPELLAEPDPT